jgi:2,5-diamino-6-(ribosylamino)-4(3H)-pyrimidinone 5'-phosphate reductase
MLPRVILHNAVSLDGRMDWFTPDIGLFYELTSHWKEDATLAGSNTIFNPDEAHADEPEASHQPSKGAPQDTRPLLAVPDSRGRVRNWRWLRSQPYWRETVALCSRSTPKEHLQYLDSIPVDYVISGDDRVDLRGALQELNRQYGVKVIRVDSGGTLNGVLLRAGLVDEVSVLIHPSLVGGSTPRTLFRATDLTSPGGVIRLKLSHCEQLSGDVVWLRYDVLRD